MAAARRLAAGWLGPRVRLVGVAAAAGAVVGALAVVAVGVATGDPRLAETQAFSVGALVFGFGLLGWSGSAMAGRGVEAMQRHLDTGTDWTEADSRRAMARIGGFGGGWMVGSALASAAWSALSAPPETALAGWCWSSLSATAASLLGSALPAATAAASAWFYTNRR